MDTVDPTLAIVEKIIGRTGIFQFKHPFSHILKVPEVVLPRFKWNWSEDKKVAEIELF